jgi:LysM repeat protein
LEAEAHHGASWDDLREEINAGRPVIVWVIGQMWGGTLVEYEAPDGCTTMVAAFEHTMILTGYSPDAVQVVDAYSGQYQTYSLRTFLKSWAVLGNMAVFSPLVDFNNDDPQGTETQGGSYTVQPGEYLVELADRFGATWQELAQLNSIGYPYTIFPGQMLQLPGGELQEDEAQTEPEPESEPAEPPPTSSTIIFQVRLPIVQRNSAIQSTSPIMISPVLPEPADTVIVRNSNTLVSFAKSIGIDWRLLAELNDLQPPYLVHPGQVLKLR